MKLLQYLNLFLIWMIFKIASNYIMQICGNVKITNAKRPRLLSVLMHDILLGSISDIRTPALLRGRLDNS